MARIIFGARCDHLQTVPNGFDKPPPTLTKCVKSRAYAIWKKVAPNPPSHAANFMSTYATKKSRDEDLDKTDSKRLRQNDPKKTSTKNDKKDFDKNDTKDK